MNREEPPGLAERAGCFGFVAMPLISGFPVFSAWATVVGDWILTGYTLFVALSLAYIVYLLERAD
jgi:hypothetical protein